MPSLFRPLLSALLSTLALGAATGACAQTTYKCVEGGATVYQAHPCPDSANQATLKAPAAPPTGAEINRTMDFMSTYQACADVVTIFREEMAPLYAEWRRRNAFMVGRIEGDPELRRRLEAQALAKRNGRASQCRPIGLELRGVKG